VIFGSPHSDLLWHIHVYRANNYISWCKKIYLPISCFWYFI